MFRIFTKAATFLFALFLLFQQTHAQAPVITHKAGIPMNANCTGVAYGNGVYVCVLSAGTIYISNDGATWNRVVDPGIVAGTFNKMSFGAGLFVVVGANGLILTSPNGLNWTTRTSGTSNHFLHVTYIQSAFYATGRNATLRRSADGITWNTITIGVGSSTDDFNCIDYGNGAFAIGSRPTVGNGVSVYRSTTGNSSSWTYQNFSPSSSLNKLMFLKDKFYIVCSGTEIFTSTNASTWTNSSASLILTQPNATVATLSSPNQIFNGIYDGTKIYLFGYSGGYYQSYGSIFSSTDGINFTLEPKTAYIVCQGSAYINNRYFEFGNEGIVSSTDGLNYKYPNGSYFGLASSGSSYVAIGWAGSSGVITSSTDFSTWTDRGTASQNPLNTVIWDGSKYMAAGDRTVVQSTDNGVTWSQILTSSDYFSTLAYGSGKYVASSYDVNTYAAKIAYSSDGISWTTANTDNNSFWKIKFVNGRFFALGYNNDTYTGKILYSTNGTAWSDITPSLAFPVYYFHDVVYDGTKYHFIGMEVTDAVNYYVDLFSVSTATPTNTASFANKAVITTPPAAHMGSWNGDGAFAYSNGHFVGSVNNFSTGATYIVYSADGTSWSVVDGGELSGVFGIVPEGNVFKMAGVSGGFFTATFNALLPVKLVDFTASPVNDHSLLQWKTSSEMNSDYFTVQFSTDRISWKNIGTVKAAGQSQHPLSYQFIHTNPVKGINYYRLLQTDLDGKQETSIVKQVYIGKTGRTMLYPNPAREAVQVTLPGTGYAMVTLFNAAGQQVYQQSGSGSIMQLSLGSLSKGIYQVVINQGTIKYTQQLSHQ